MKIYLKGEAREKNVPINEAREERSRHRHNQQRARKRKSQQCHMMIMTVKEPQEHHYPISKDQRVTGQAGENGKTWPSWTR